jgi:acyl dehydratase
MIAAIELPVSVGDETSFTKTIGESDVYLFAGITGDFAPNHIDEQFMRGTAYGRRMAHGAMLMGFMSTTSTLMSYRTRPTDQVPVSLGYDRVRFLAPVFIGDTITVKYRISALDLARRRATANIEVVSQSMAVVAVAVHILKWIDS